MMGSSPSRYYSSETETKKATKRNRDITDQLEHDRVNNMRIIKLLLLGSAESGKSTFAKQMKILHEAGFSQAERLGYRHLVFSNTLHAMRDVVNAMYTFNIPFQDYLRESDVKLLDIYCKQMDRNSIEFDTDISLAVKRLWKDLGLQQCFARAAEFQLNDSAEYFITSVDRFSQPEYIPTEQDILRTRLKTCGIVQTSFQFKDYTFRLFDVGGQRSERRKWIHCFDNVTAIIFTAAISEYDQVLREDNRTNRLHESLNLFHSTYNSPFFVRTCFILFLNKKDIFENKIKTYSIKQCFPGYTGRNTFSETSEYIRKQFESVQGRRGKEIYSHMTVATDTSNISFVFDASMSVVLKNNLEEAGMF